MPGLLDMYLQSQGQQGGGGLLGNVNSFLNNNQDALMALGLGMAGGNTAMEGFRGGMQGFLQGRKSDQARVAGQDFMKDLTGATATPAAPAPAGMPQMTPPQAQPTTMQAGVPRGIRNNNPLNIEAGPFTQGMPGFTGSDGRFARFQSPEQGIAAANTLLDTYQNKHGLNTVAGIINRWAPPGENDARGYAASVAGRLGVRPDQPLTPEQRIPLIQAMGQFENGRPIPMGSPSQAMGFNGAPERPDAQGVYSADAVMTPQQPPQAQPAPFQVAQAGGGPVPAPGARAPAPLPGQQTPDALGAIRNMPIGTVLKWAMNPNLTGPQQDVAKEIFKARLEDTKMTEAQKDYMRARVDGFTGSFADFKNQPSYGPIGKDRFGSEQLGFRNPNTLSVAPAQVGGQQPGQSGQAPIALVTDLRKEVQAIPSYKNITQAAPVYKSMMDAAGRDNRAADVNMIYGLAKIMDPPSVVRESEMTIARAVATLPQQLQASIMSQISSTGRLDPATRQAIMGEAHSRITAYKGEFDRDASQYRGIINDYKITPSHVIPEFGEFPQFKSKTAEPPAAAAPPEAAAALRQNPALREQFDAKYGQGAASRILGGQ